MRRENNTKCSLKKTLKEMDKLEDLIVDGKIILKCFQYYRVEICGNIYLSSTVSVVSSCKHGHEH